MNLRRFALSILAVVFLCSFTFAGDDIKSSVTGVSPAVQAVRGSGRSKGESRLRG